MYLCSAVYTSAIYNFLIFFLLFTHCRLALQNKVGVQDSISPPSIASKSWFIYNQLLERAILDICSVNLGRRVPRIIHHVEFAGFFGPQELRQGAGEVQCCSDLQPSESVHQGKGELERSWPWNRWETGAQRYTNSQSFSLFVWRIIFGNFAIEIYKTMSWIF